MSHYTVIREIGRGGFGVVEEVEDEEGQRFARKRFQPAPHNLPHRPVERETVLEKLRKRFKREVLTQQELSGPEIMSVVDSDMDCQEPWFVMPLAEKTYESQISDDRASGSITIQAIADIMNGLEYIHDMGYVHRDLNPKNVLLHEGHWKLTDFGAVLPPSGQTITLTENTTIYTELYCSPEQHGDFHNVQSPSDVYSLGCILHDLVGSPPRTPYARHSADGTIGILIEKCTDTDPKRRPPIPKLRDLVLEELAETGGHFQIKDKESEEWISKLASIDTWPDDEYEAFLRFFKNLDQGARTEGHEGRWVGTLSTPFLTHLSATALATIAKRQDGLSEAIVEEYCNWVRSTAYSFGFADNICSRLVAIFDNGTKADKARAFAALIHLGSSHNRWYVMRVGLARCGRNTPEDLAKRLAIELRMESLVSELRQCVSVIQCEKESLAGEVAKLC